MGVTKFRQVDGVRRKGGHGVLGAGLDHQSYRQPKEGP